MERPFPGSPTGWAFVEQEMEPQINRGRASAEDYERSMRGGFRVGTDYTQSWKGERCRFEAPIWPSHMKSWTHYQDWKRGHNGEVPREINRIRTDAEFDRWANAGFPDEPTVSQIVGISPAGELRWAHFHRGTDSPEGEV